MGTNVSKEHTASIFYPEVEGSILLRNVDTLYIKPEDQVVDLCCRNNV
jgi:hypothetical protein